MRIPTWRLVLTGVAIVILAAMGVGLVAAASSPPAAPSTNSAGAPAASPATPKTSSAGPALRRLIGRLGRVGEGPHRFVDGTLNFTDQSGAIVSVQLDHGTIAAIAADSITIDEAGGKQVTVSTDSSTVVRLGGGAGLGKLGDLKTGDEIFVQSRLDGGTALAKHILRVPAGKAAAAAPSTTGG